MVKKINVWNCSILGQPPHSSLPGLTILAECARSQGFHTLHDLSLWDSSGCWTGWKDLHPLAHLEEATTLFLSSLHGLSPSRESARDRIGWGKTGHYSVKERYMRLYLDPAANDRLWRKVWHPDNILKVNSFIWILMHNKLLTVENLRKHGF